MSFLKLRGAHVPHRKNTADCKAERMPVPKTVTIPVVMHIGAPAKPVVKPGMTVKVGQMVAEAGGFVSAPIFTGVSGKVKKIDDVLISNGQYVPAVVIESDGLQEVYEEIQKPNVTNMQEFVDAVRASGIVGLGGAGFPTSVKLSVKDLSQLEVLIVNGAECEPYITSDTRTMLDDAEAVIDGIRLVMKYLNIKKTIIGIENNKPQCVKKLRELAGSNSGIEVRSLPAMYPQGGEKVLIYNTTGKIVPEGGLPLNVGAIVMNCTTLAAISHYMETGMPLIEKCVTVDGSAVNTPKNVIAPIGTPVGDLFEFCGGFKTTPAKVLYGGPMMGIALPDLNCPVLKNTNAVLAFDEKDAQQPEETSCICCAKCIDTCPLKLMPAAIESAYKNNDMELLEKLKVNLCMECGCCSFICPARRHLVQTNKLAKAKLRNYQNAKKAAEEKKKEAVK
ncbi:MAG: electron transport complex subunit RsxC [Ruminococcaceae bacterium]|nr:electron transport complex subunit RsxC [Oscillospiraceae bacterium]